jgi:hypothetical protein
MAIKRLGLLMATTGYADPQFPGVAESTAHLKELTELLQSGEFGGFSLTVLVDPTLAAARSAIVDLLANRDPDDLVLLYAIGHLVKQSDDTLFLALRETDRSDLQNTALAAESVQQQLQETAAKSQIIVLDGRFGSIVSPEILVDRDRPMDVGLKFYVPNRDQAIVATSDYLSFCLAGAHYVAVRSGQSALTESILRGLRDGAADEEGDRQVTVNELLSYLNKGSVRRDEMVAGWVSQRAGDLLFAAYPETVAHQVREPSTGEPEVPPGLEANRASPLDENVKFTAYRPAVMRPEQWRRMIVFMHLDDELEPRDPKHVSAFEEVETRARQILGAEYDDYRDVVGESRFPIARESEITLVPEVPGIQFNPPRRSFFWASGVRVHEESFFMRAPFALAGKLIRGRLSIFFGHLLLAEIALNLRVGEDLAPIPTTKEENWGKDVAKPFRKIFASYSHQDVEVVEAMEKHIRAIGYEYLRDVVQLRSGQRWDERLIAMITDADIFQLFWSRNSAQSVQVEKEWRHAIALQREAFVRPAYWEIPMPEAPEPLRRLHFYLLPGVHAVVDRRKGNDTDREPSEPVGDKGTSAEGSKISVVVPPAEPSAPTESKSSSKGKTGRTGSPPSPDEKRSRGAAQPNAPLPPPAAVPPPANNRRAPDLTSGSGPTDPVKIRGKTNLRWGTVLGTLIGGCFVVFLSINLINRTFFSAVHPISAAPSPTPTSNALPPAIGTPSAVEKAPALATPTPIPAETPTPTLTKPFVTPTPQPNATPSPVEPSVKPSPALTASPSPSAPEPSMSPSPAAAASPSPDETASESPTNTPRHHRYHRHHHKR